MSLKIVFLCVGLLGMPARAAEVKYDASSPQLTFAAQEVASALGDYEGRVVFEIKANAQNPESFLIETPNSKTIRIVGADAAGAMYGGLDVAELIRIGGFKRVKGDEQAP
jgi:hypothetical protein